MQSNHSAPLRCSPANHPPRCVHTLGRGWCQRHSSRYSVVSFSTAGQQEVRASSAIFPGRKHYYRWALNYARESAPSKCTSSASTFLNWLVSSLPQLYCKDRHSVWALEINPANIQCYCTASGKYQYSSHHPAHRPHRLTLMRSWSTFHPPEFCTESRSAWARSFKQAHGAFTHAVR